MKKVFLFLFLVMINSMLFTQCDCNKPKPPVTDSTHHQVTTTITAPAFNADTAFVFVKKQVAFGPRIPNTAAQTKCATWLEKKLKAYCSNVVVQKTSLKVYDGHMVPCINLIASFNPQNPKRILLFAHWDTRPWSDQDSVIKNKPFDGADDGGSGVGILLEMARQFQMKAPDVGVDIALFDVEDYGPPSFETKWDETDQYALGTQYWCNNPHAANYKAYFGVLLDMTGAHGATFCWEETSRFYAPDVLNKVWTIAQQQGYGNYFIKQNVSGVIDDHYYVNKMNGTPCADIINMNNPNGRSFAPHWHTQQDNMNVIDANTLKAVGQTLMQVVYQEKGSF